MGSTSIPTNYWVQDVEGHSKRHEAATGRGNGGDTALLKNHASVPRCPSMCTRLRQPLEMSRAGSLIPLPPEASRVLADHTSNNRLLPDHTMRGQGVLHTCADVGKLAMKFARLQQEHILEDR